MPAACLAASPATTAEDPARGDQSVRPTLAEVLDLQEVEVPGTADALQHFFPEA
jgi:hypothetical protein